MWGEGDGALYARLQSPSQMRHGHLTSFGGGLSDLRPWVCVLHRVTQLSVRQTADQRCTHSTHPCIMSDDAVLGAGIHFFALGAAEGVRRKPLMAQRGRALTLRRAIVLPREMGRADLGSMRDTWY